MNSFILTELLWVPIRALYCSIVMPIWDLCQTKLNCFVLFVCLNRRVCKLCLLLTFVCPLGKYILTSTTASSSFLRSTTTSFNISTSTTPSFNFLRSRMTSLTLFVLALCASCTECLINVSANTMVPVRSMLAAMISMFFELNRRIYKEINIFTLEIHYNQYYQALANANTNTSLHNPCGHICIYSKPRNLKNKYVNFNVKNSRDYKRTYVQQTREHTLIKSQKI